MADLFRYYLHLLLAKAGRGKDLVEYAVIIVLISVATIPSWTYWAAASPSSSRN